MTGYADIATICSITMLYPFFFYRLTDYLTRKERPENLPYYCDTNNCTSDQALELEKWEEHVNNKELIMMVTLLTVGILTVASSGFIKSGPTKLGIGLGGLICVIISILFYWNRYREPIKLLIIGSALAISIMISVRASQIESYTDILVPRYN